MLKHFSLDRVVKSEASFDPQKLTTFQGRYMNDLPIKRKTKMCLSFLQAAILVADPPPCDISDYLERIITAAGDRICMAGDILNFDTFFIDDSDVVFDDKPFQKRLVKPENAGGLLADFQGVLKETTDFTAAALEKTLHDFCESNGIGPGDIIHALRVGVTGKAAGFGMFDTLELLGQDRCVNRIQLALDKLAAA